MNVAPMLFVGDQTQSPYGRGAFAYRRVTFFASAKKVTKETPFREIKPAHGTCSFKQFSDSPSMARSENGGHPWPPPLRCFRLGRRLKVCEGQTQFFRVQKCYRDSSKPTLVLDLPDIARATVSGHPEGGRHGCRSFSDQAMDGLSENGDSTPHRLSEVELTRKVLSFGYFSLHQQRKVTRRKAKPLHARRAVDFDPLQDDRNNNAPTEITMSGKQAATVVDRHLPKEAAPCVAG